MVSWKDKMDARYGDNAEQELPYWDGVMLSERKELLAAQGFKGVDKSLELLRAKGYRVVKSSAFTPRGIYDKDHTVPVSGEPAADNLFFEQNFDPFEFMAIYNKYGRYENILTGQLNRMRRMLKGVIFLFWKKLRLISRWDLPLFN
ncbi:MAG: hypothetical protein E7010_02815 [Alphaproteobacteria bacterium]|nr:hypothetical protein [Alphaproteobacteria bacterium]